MAVNYPIEWSFRRVEIGAACFTFPSVHGIFISSLPPRHPPIVAVEGFSNARVNAPGVPAFQARVPPLRGVRYGLPEPPAATQAITDDFHRREGGTRVPAQSRLDLPDFDVDPT